MEEHQISIDGVTHILPTPFMTLATQNPVETYGTYHLPEAQMDRFIMKISMGYPAYEDELKIMNNGENEISAKDLKAVMTTDDIAALMDKAQKVGTAPSIRKYILNIVTATRNSENIRLGVSPRGSIALLRASKSYAFVMGRNYVVPDDVKAVMGEVLAHRLILSPKGKSAFETNEAALAAIAMTVESPTTAE